MKQNKWASALMAISVATMVSLAGCGSDTPEAPKKPATSTQQVAMQETTITMYVPMDSGDGLTSKNVKVPMNDNTVQAALRLVLQEDAKQAYPVFPKGTHVERVDLKQGIAQVHLSAAFLKGEKDGHLTNTLRLAALVNTAMKCPGVKGVTFWVQGKQLRQYGAYDLGEPLTWMKQVKVH